MMVGYRSRCQPPGAGSSAVTSGFDPKLGNLVRLDHGFGIETIYGHMAKSRGGAAGKGADVVGSGRLVYNRPHLHYMVKVNGQALDPIKYILSRPFPTL
jgi:murein DD-endopeptidase MepM/ murein hydrolase activator NlpD